jgi:LPS O-antigen subunit length determinant protein (WzzB/FepE family)
MKTNSKNNFVDFLILFFENRKLILYITSSITFLILIYALISPNIYRSSAIIAPSSNDNPLQETSTFSSFTSFSALDLLNESAKVSEGIERMKSLYFFENYFLPYIKLEDLMAVKSWDYENNIINSDKTLFDATSNKWVRDVDYPLQVKPTSQESYEYFLKIFSITPHLDTSFFLISIEHQSPIIAHEWLELIIKNININLRDEDKAKATEAIDFLNNYSLNTNIQYLEDSISNLLESQLKAVMLASATEDYAFKLIDKPFIPEEKSKPYRALLCILGAFFGAFISLLVVLTKDFYETNFLESKIQ